MTYNELQSFTVTVAFFDETGTPAIPDQVEWRLDNATTGNNIVPATPVTPGTTVDIEVTRAMNAMTSGKPTEIMTLTVDYSWSSGTKGGTVQYPYVLQQLSFVPVE